MLKSACFFQRYDVYYGQGDDSLASPVRNPFRWAHSTFVGAWIKMKKQEFFQNQV